MITAVGLASIRSILLIIARETPERSARSARVQFRLFLSVSMREASAVEIESGASLSLPITVNTPNQIRSQYIGIISIIVDRAFLRRARMHIRIAEEKDMQSVTDIYNEVLRTSTAIYRDVEATLEERTEWWRNLDLNGYPLLLATEDDRVLGFACYGEFRSWPGYRYTVEGSIHLRPDARRSGTGTKLLHHLIDHARAAGKHMLIAGVDAENLPSRRFMERSGAEQTAHLKEVGFKFGRYLDLVLYQIRLS